MACLLSHLNNIYQITFSSSLQCLMSVLMLVSSNVFVLINYFSQVLWLSVAACIAALLWLRRTQPHINRPIRVHLSIPITFLVCCVLLTAVPVIEDPVNTGQYKEAVPDKIIILFITLGVVDVVPYKILQPSQKSLYFIEPTTRHTRFCPRT